MGPSSWSGRTRHDDRLGRWMNGQRVPGHGLVGGPGSAQPVIGQPVRRFNAAFVHAAQDHRLCPIEGKGIAVQETAIVEAARRRGAARTERHRLRWTGGTARAPLQHHGVHVHGERRRIGARQRALSGSRLRAGARRPCSVCLGRPHRRPARRSVAAQDSRRAPMSMSARPVSGSLRFARARGDSVSTSSRVGHIRALKTWPPCAEPSALPTTT
jgi:hypothetical protein